ncbi:MAG: bifunctional oligoribonuclease/PAP phosphatase NrnA [bacterium]|nr:bifunctional oligoribonuclease/PAP phosphatase NrnA [bacterium]
MQFGFSPQQLDAQLARARSVVVVGHVQPDADCLGSLTVFACYLESRGCAVTLYCATPAPVRLQFLPGVCRLRTTAPGPYDAVVVLDCGDLKHAHVTPEQLARWSPRLVVNIDHHQTNTRFGDINLVQPAAASTTEILYQYFRALDVPITPKIATSLLAGIVGDTGGFHHANTSPAALNAAAELVAAGASLPELFSIAFGDKTVPALQRWGPVLSRITVHPRYQVALAVITRADLSGLPDEAAAASGMANFLNTLDGVRAVVVLVEQADGTIRGSLRARDPLLDVAKFATLCGGGGHKLAAGFSIKGRLQETPRGWQITS